MDIKARIERRQHRDGQSRLVQDFDPLSPVTHIEEPTDRGPILERLLDHLDPVFDGKLPPNAYLYGPKGAGKSAVVTALFAYLAQLPSESQAVIHTSTRAQSPTSPMFVYVDARETPSEFAFYHAVLDALTDDTVPEHGIGTETLRSRLHDILDHSKNGVVIAVDHADEPDPADDLDLISLFAGLPSNVSWLAVGRTDPTESRFTNYTANSIFVKAYERQMLVDVLMTRATLGLSHQALDHSLARKISEWADGDAHDALAVLFMIAEYAEQNDRNHLDDADFETAIGEMPTSCVSIGRVLSLPPNRQRVLRELVDLEDRDRESVSATTEAIASLETVDLSQGTVKRFLYELAESGIVERVRSESKQTKGRPPSRVVPQFPPTVFRKLYDLGTQ